MDNRSFREEPKKWIAGCALGVVMACVGIILIISLIVNMIGSDSALVYLGDKFFRFLSRITLIIGGGIIIFGRLRGNYYAVGVYAVTLGTSRILRSLPGLMSLNDVIFYANVVFIIVGVNLVLAGVNHLTVRTRDPTFMRYTATAIVMGFLLLELFILYARVEPSSILEVTGDTLAYIPLYIALLFVLYSKELIRNRPMGRIKGFAGVSADSLSIGNDASISADDCSKLKEGFNASGWSTKAVGGRNVMEETISLSTKRGDRDVVLNRWDGDPCLYISIVNDIRDSFVSGYRIKANGYEEHDGRIDLLDDMGVCASIRVEEGVQ